MEESEKVRILQHEVQFYRNQNAKLENDIENLKEEIERLSKLNDKLVKPLEDYIEYMKYVNSIIKDSVHKRDNIVVIPRMQKLLNEVKS